MAKGTSKVSPRKEFSLSDWSRENRTNGELTEKSNELPGTKADWLTLIKLKTPKLWRQLWIRSKASCPSTETRKTAVP
jgi:hypothetical protein